MRTKFFLLFFLTGMLNNLIAQNSNTIFETLTTELKNYKIDTSAVPQDKITKKIIEIRESKGGFNINEALQYKIGEEKAKGEKQKEELEQLTAYFTTGHGSQLLNNAVIWIYRNQFTYKQLKKIARFYKTNAGQKLSSVFPVIMLKSLAAAEIITKAAAK